MYDQHEQDRLRKLWRKYWTFCGRLEAEYRKEHGMEDEEEYPYVFGVRYPPFPDVLRALTCGAKTRKGTPCKRTDLYHSGRCKFHGGLSTGPTTPEGKKKCAENGKITARSKDAEPDPMKG